MFLNVNIKITGTTHALLFTEIILGWVLISFLTGHVTALRKVWEHLIKMNFDGPKNQLCCGGGGRRTGRERKTPLMHFWIFLTEFWGWRKKCRTSTGAVLTDVESQCWQINHPGETMSVPRGSAPGATALTLKLNSAPGTGQKRIRTCQRRCPGKA